MRSTSLLLVLATTALACSPLASSPEPLGISSSESEAPDASTVANAQVPNTAPGNTARKEETAGQVDRAATLNAVLDESADEDQAPGPSAEPLDMEEVSNSIQRAPSHEQLGMLHARKAASGTAAFSRSADTRAAAPPPPSHTPYVTPNTESYTHYGVNPMTLASRDHLSTFSVDVDTASYSIARRKLRSGVLPPTASVRVEEFVNSQDYGYTPPTDEAPFAVYLEAAPNPFLDGHHVLRVGVKGKEIDDEERNPVHLTFLVDVSGSMSSSDKLGLAKQSLHELVENLEPQDTVALATYAGHVARVLDPMPVTSTNARQIHQAIEMLESGGGTGMSSGVDLAYQMASAGFVKGEENRVIVLSDGDANIGPASHTAILQQIKGYAESGITLSTIGLGMGNYKDVMMEQLANNGDGNYFYIDSIKEAQKVFGEDLSGTLQVIAKDVKIQVDFNPEAVHSYRLIGYENRDIADKDFRNDRVDAGEIGAGHSVTALYDIILADSGESELATVRLRNKRPGADSAAVEWNTPFPTELLHASFAGSRDDFQIAYGAASFADLLRGSPYGAELTYSELYDLVARASRRGHEEDQELLELIARAGELSGERGPVAWR